MWMWSESGSWVMGCSELSSRLRGPAAQTRYRAQPCTSLFRPLCFPNSPSSIQPARIIDSPLKSCLDGTHSGFEALDLLALPSPPTAVSTARRNHVQGQILYAQLAMQTSSWTRPFPSHSRRHQNIRLLLEEKGPARTAPHNCATRNRGVCCSQQRDSMGRLGVLEAGLGKEGRRRQGEERGLNKLFLHLR